MSRRFTLRNRIKWTHQLSCRVGWAHIDLLPVGPSCPRRPPNSCLPHHTDIVISQYRHHEGVS